MGDKRAVRRGEGEKPSGRLPVPEGLPPGLPPDERRPARMRVVAGRRLGGLTVVLDGLHDPHNISAALRSCEGFGVQHVHLIGEPADLPMNRIVTCGCEKWLSLHYHPDATTCVAAVRAEGFELWAAVPCRDAVPLRTIDFSRKTALIFGAERLGLSEELVSRCDGKYFIPMAGFVESFNVSVAVAVSLYGACRARRRAVGGRTDLSAEEVEDLARSWAEADDARRARKRP